MSKIIAFKSDFDGKLFEFQEDYTKHLRKLAAKRREDKKRIQHRTNRELFLDKMGQVSSFDELEQFIKDNWSFFRLNAEEHSHGKRFRPKDDNLIGLDLDVNMFSQNVSNSHKCPRKGGVTNFETNAAHNKGKPTSYPGWRGRIKFSVTSSTTFGSAYFDETPIGTGSGGGGDSDKSYDLTLWAADFPLIWKKHARQMAIDKENRERQQVWRSLGGVGTPELVTEVPEGWTVPDPLMSW